jgi:hypothetical protein
LSWLSITLDGERTAYEPGDRVRGTVSWMVEGEPESVEAHLLWYTEGKGDQDVAVVATAALPAAAEGSAELDLQLPIGPWSFSGKLVSLLWAVELAVEPGIAATRQPIVVAPHGEEVRLPVEEPPAPK